MIYVRVSFQESLRKNRRRFNPDRPHSILEHALPDEKLARLYREDDWGQLAAADPRFLAIRGRRVPYAVFENEDDLTTPGGEALGKRLEQVLGGLWTLAAGGQAVRILKSCPPPDAAVLKATPAELAVAAVGDRGVREVAPAA